MELRDFWEVGGGEGAAFGFLLGVHHFLCSLQWRWEPLNSRILIVNPQHQLARAEAGFPWGACLCPGWTEGRLHLSVCLSVLALHLLPIQMVSFAPTCPVSCGCSPIKHLLTAIVGPRNCAQQDKPVCAHSPVGTHAGTGQKPNRVSGCDLV